MKANHTSFIYSPRRYKQLIDWMMKTGHETTPRGMRTIEVVDAHLIIRDPRDRLIFDPSRKMNIALAAAELFQIVAGDDDAEFLAKFAKRMLDFSEDGKIGGAYGPRIHEALPTAIEKLRKDPDSRQAIITIYTSDDLNAKPHMVPCTVSLQFFIRNGHLHLITNMRSNDVVWGLTYDVFVFTMLQEAVAQSLSVPLGEYHHNDGSLHFYVDRDDALIDKLSTKKYTLRMEPMQSAFGPSLEPYYIARKAEALWTREFWHDLDKFPRDPVVKDLLITIRHWFARRAGDTVEEKSAYHSIHDPAIRKVVSNWRLSDVR